MTALQPSPLRCFAVYARIVKPAPLIPATQSSQVLIAQAYGKARRWHLAPEHVFIDVGVSSGPRPELQRLMSVVGRGKPPFRNIVVDDDVSLFENKSAQRELVRFFWRHGVAFSYAVLSLKGNSQFCAKFRDLFFSLEQARSAAMAPLIEAVLA